MTLRPLRCVVASGPDQLALVRAAHIGLPFAGKINKRAGMARVVTVAIITNAAF